MIIFGERFRELRIADGKNQKEMSVLLNVTQATVSNWEAGRKIPEMNMLITIAKYFHVPTDYLLGLIDYYE